MNVYKHLRDIGCCERCSLRFLSERDPTAYVDLDQHLEKKGFERNPNEGEEAGDVKCSPCTICLGLLQETYMDDIIERICSKILDESYDSPAFTCALSLPVCFQLRAHSLWLYLRDKFPEYFDLDLTCYEKYIVPLKEVWKWTITPVITNKVQKVFDAGDKCDFFVNVNVVYVKDEEECAHMQRMSQSFFAERRVQKRKFRGELYTRKAVEQLLPTIDAQVFRENFPSPPVAPSSPANISSIVCSHNSIYFAGRYNKFSRMLSQTPWLIDGERRMESSVQEIISEKIQSACLADGTRFSSSGREDVDVRMLGRGRPFAVELLNPRRTSFSRDEVHALQVAINDGQPSSVIVRDLQLVTRDCLAHLKEGEQVKQKRYEALCIFNDPLPLPWERLKALSGLAPLRLYQMTPIRVLHRRPLAKRTRMVYSLKAVDVADQPDLFKLEIVTQAGTYIKEFVHGDFGRTTPDLGHLLGGVRVDILALDVLDIMVDWPPQIGDN